MHQGSSAGTVIPALDGIRGIAILSVILHHCLYLPPSVPFGREFNGMMQAGRLGVAIFFVLSGFLMGLVVFRQDRPFAVGNYARRRFARIYPAFTLSLVFAGAISIYLGNDFREVLPSCLLSLAAVANETGVPVEVNSVYWSLLIEIHFYILLPVLYLLLRRMTPKADWWTCGLMAVVPVSIRIWKYFGTDAGATGWSGFTLTFPTRMDAFAIGLIFAVLFLSGSVRKLSPRMLGGLGSSGAWLITVVFVVYGLTFVIPEWVAMQRQAIFLESAYLLSQLGVFLLMFGCFIQGGTWARVLTHPALVFCGLVSYEWYLFHYPILHLCRELLPSGSFVGYSAKLAISTVGTLALSALIYHKFSRPLQTWIRG